MKNKLIEILQAMGRVAFTNTEKADYLLANDVVPVVRCKNCRHWCETSCQIKVSQHGLYSDDFCSCGERGASK